MDDMENHSQEQEWELAERLKTEKRKKRIEEMKEEKRRHQQRLGRIKRALIVLGAVVVLGGILWPVCSSLAKNKAGTDADTSLQEPGKELPEQADVFQNAAASENAAASQKEAISASTNAEAVNPDAPYASSDAALYGLFDGYELKTTDSTGYIWDEEVVSEYAVLVNAGTGNIVAQKEADTRINPASMTKILTLLVAAEHIKSLEDKVTIDIETTDYAFSHDLSAVGFDKGESVTVEDLLYGTILPSGGDAAYALARYVAGSQDAFVELMNDKIQELGISATAHFTNCVGIYDENHYCTVKDMAIILKAAVENELCRQVLSEHIYTTSATQQHPEGITISNLFLRRIEDKDTHGEVLCAKTGFVAQSGSCAASYQISNDGSQYICVTGKSSSAWRCIYDHVQIYTDYTK